MTRAVGFKILWPILGFASAFMAMAYFVWLPNMVNTSISQAENRLSHTIETVGEGLVPPLLEGELFNIYDTLDRVKMRDAHWVSIELFDAQNRSIYPLLPDPNLAFSDNYFYKTEPVLANGMQIGSLVVVYDLSKTIAEVRSSVFRLFAIFVGMLVTFIFLAVYVLNTLVVAPIRTLNRASKAMADMDFDSMLPVASSDEVGALIRNFGKMRAALQTAQLDLIRARKHAEHASQIKSDFLANMSHELRTPMTGVLGMTELLMERVKDPVNRDYLETISSSGSALLSILNNILDLSKIEAGAMTVEAVNTDVSSVISDVARLFEPKAHSKGLVLNWKQATDPVWAVTDEVKLRQILSNLVNNAVKFTEKGEVTIDFLPKRRSGVLHVSISDTGRGIDPKDIDKVFEKFSQADHTITRTYGGTGLGLTITQHLVHAMGGEISVRSERGEGAIFTIEIPVKFIEAPQKAEQTNTIAKIDQTKRVLVVDDDPLNRLFLQKVLEKLDMTDFEFAENGELALGKVKDSAFDLVFMDCQMPLMDGYTAARHLRAYEEETGQNRIPVVAITANAMMGDRQKCLDAGMDDMITKPFTVESVQSALATWG